MDFTIRRIKQKCFITLNIPTMLFNSYTFLVFFAIVLILHNLPFSWKTKKINLLMASYVFYAAWNPPFILFCGCPRWWIFLWAGHCIPRKINTRKNCCW